MNWFDLLLLLVIAFYVTVGFIRGALKQLINLGGFFVSLALAFWGTPYLSYVIAFPLQFFGLTAPGVPSLALPQFETLTAPGEALTPLKELLTVEQLGGLAGAVSVFLVLLLLLAVAFRLLMRLLKAVNKIPVIGTFNRLGGALLGLLMALFLGFVVISLAALLPVSPVEEGLNGSVIAGHLKTCLPQLFAGFEEKIAVYFLRPPAGGGI